MVSLKAREIGFLESMNWVIFVVRMASSEGESTASSSSYEMWGACCGK